MNGKISTSNNSSFFTLTSSSVTSKHYKLCSLQIPIHDKIKYSYLSKTQANDVSNPSYIMETRIKLLAHRTWHYVILEYLPENKSMKEVVS